MKDIFGPWSVVKEPDFEYDSKTGVRIEFNRYLVNDSNGKLVSYFDDRYSDRKNTEQIVNMVATAPEMYEALDGVEFYIEEYLRSAIETNERINERDGCAGEDSHVRNIRESLAALRNAMKKARGES